MPGPALPLDMLTKMPASTALISAWSRASNSPPMLPGPPPQELFSTSAPSVDDVFQRLDALGVVEGAIVA